MIRDELEAALTRVYFAERKDRLAKEMADAVVEILRTATPKQIKELIG